MNKVEMLKERIDNLEDYEAETIADLFREINKIKRRSKRLELYEHYINKVRNTLINVENLEKKLLEEDIQEVKSNLIVLGNLNAKTVDKLFERNYFNVDDILEENKEIFDNELTEEERKKQEENRKAEEEAKEKAEEEAKEKAEEEAKEKAEEEAKEKAEEEAKEKAEEEVEKKAEEENKKAKQNTATKEIEKIEKQIKDIENSYLNITLQKDILSRLDKEYGELSLSQPTTEEEIRSNDAKMTQLEIEIKNIGIRDNYLSLEEIKKLYEKYGFSYDDIVASIKKNNPEIKEELPSLEHVNSQIENLTNELSAKNSSLTTIEEQIATLTDELEKERKKLNDLQNFVETQEVDLTEEEKKELKEIEEEIERRKQQEKKSIEDLESRLEELKNKKVTPKVDDLTEEEKKEIQEKEAEKEKLQEQIEKIKQTKSIHNAVPSNRLINQMNDIQRKLAVTKDEEARKSLNAEFKELNDEYQRRKQKENLEEQIEKIGKRLEELKNKEVTPKVDDLTEEEKKELKEIEEEIERRKQQENNIYLSLDEEELNRKKENYENLVNRYGFNSKEAKELDKINEAIKRKQQEKKSIEDLESRLEELKNKKKTVTKQATPEEIAAQQKRVNDKIAELEAKKTEKNELNNSIAEINNKINNLNKTKEEIEKLSKLKNYKRTYYNIKNEGTRKFNSVSDNENLSNDIANFVNNHAEISVFDDYEQKDKLKKELAEEIENKVKEQIPTKVEKNERVWTRALASVAGFAFGVGLSCVPGVGWIRMGIAGAKFVASQANCYSKNHEDSFVAKIVNKVKDRYNKFTSKHPKIMWAAEKARNALKNPELNAFVNGTSLGYIAGNVFEMIKGETVYEFLKPDTPQIDNVVAIQKPIPSPLEDTVADVIDTVPEIDPSTVEINIGDVIDMSDFEYGYMDEYTDKVVHMMEDGKYGKDAVVEFIEKVNDRTRVHFKQANGLNYGWFDLEQAQEAKAKGLEAAQEVLKNVGKSR